MKIFRSSTCLAKPTNLCKLYADWLSQLCGKFLTNQERRFIISHRKFSIEKKNWKKCLDDPNFSCFY